jgi:iron complex outermembrane receptor protein
VSDDSGGEIQEVRVTGSRLVVLDGFQAPTPLTVMSADQLATAAPTSLSDSLNQLPIFRNSNTPASTGVGTTGNVGQSFLNLRSLGAQRTLILLDGRRIVPSTANGTTDISILPDALLSRVDVVTGGASAAYGSDAVAGVVNFVLDTKLEGLKLTAQGGIADAGDYENGRVALSGGTQLFGGRGHLVGSASFYRNGGIVAWRDRDWYDSCSRITNPALTPNTVIACGVHSAGFTRGGLITGGPLRGTEFGIGGVPQPFQYGSLASTLSMVGGSGEDHGANFPAVPKVERTTGFAHARYDLTDNFTVFLEGLYGESKAHYGSTAPWEGQTTAYTIYNDNAFLHPSVVQRMADAGVTSFPMWRYNYDFGLLIADSRNRTKRVTTGFQGKIGEWSINGYYEHGENTYHQTTQNNPIVNRLYNAVDAVVGPNGQIVCRSTLTQPDNGCVPLNIFGYGSPSTAALAWVTGTTWQDQLVKQEVVDVSIAGKPFELWAGPVSVAFGGGYRRESSNQVVDDISQQIRTFTGGYQGFPTSLEGQLGGWERTNPQPLSGKYDVSEVFAETLVPLLRDAPGATSLDLNAAARFTDYSTSGSVTTWKLGLTYSPVDSVRFRGTVSRDIRAANLTELFTGATQGQGNLTDPFQPLGSPNRTPVVMVRSFGNSTLKPEEADTRTLGVVFQPEFLPGFEASLDFFDIEIKDAVGTLGGQVTIDQCYQGATSLCSLLHRDSDGVLVSVDTPYLNISSRTTRGFDVELVYRRPQVWGGTLDVRGLATYVDKLTTQNPGAPLIDGAGQTGIAGGVPKWVANASVGYQHAPSGFSVFLQERYIGSGALDKTLSAAMLDPADNRVSAVFYTDLTLTKRIGDIGTGSSGAEFFATVNNLFDRNPPVAPSPWFVFGVSNGHTNTSLFDVVGRQYSAGVRVRF